MSNKQDIKNANGATKYLAVAILALLVLGGAAFFIFKDNEKSLEINSTPGTSHSDGNKDNGEIVPNKDKTDAEKNIIDLTNSSEVKISISDFAFSSQNIKVKKGTKLIWTNNDQSEHSVVSSNSGSELGSELFGIGETYEHEFNSVGVFDYHCSAHPFMEGSVTVVD